MSKEQDIDSICLSYRHDFGLMTEDEKDALRFAAKEWLRAAEKHRFGFVGDRVANFEEWSKSYDLGKYVEQYRRGARVGFLAGAASQPQPETMGRDLTAQEALKWIKDWAALAVKPYEGHWEDLAYWLTVYRTGELAKGKPTAHPVAPEELTREFGSKEYNELVSQHAWDKLWYRILQDRATTEARVRAEYQTYEAQILSMSETAEERFNEIESLRTTIAELEKRLESAVEIDWSYYPDTIKGVLFSSTPRSEDECRVPPGEIYIPRPTPVKLTPEQMAEAWCHDALIEMGEGYTADDAHDMLFKELLDGKSIETLYAEIGKGGES